MRQSGLPFSSGSGVVTNLYGKRSRITFGFVIMNLVIRLVELVKVQSEVFGEVLQVGGIGKQVGHGREGG